MSRSGKQNRRIQRRSWRREEIRNQRMTLLLGLLAAFLLLFGCKSMPTVDKTGESLCTLQEPGAQKLSSSKELELEKKVSGESGCGDSPWQTAEAEVPKTRVGEENVNWSAQRPHGAVLFPRNLTVSGPAVVLEPKSMIAQVGSEVVMVASYIGPENERLRTGEELEWNLDGEGRFLTGNPANGLLYCDMTTTKKIDDQAMKTVTSHRLWRIHRGTSSQADDISILRGQSWATVQSFQEGTSTVSILAPDIDNWGNRTAGGQIHWIDAVFYYPRSGITPVAQPQTLTTSVFRKSTNEPRPGWIVRYQVVSGPPAGFGPEMNSEIEVMTDSIGEAKTILTPKDTAEGNSKIKIQIIRPQSGTLERVVVDEKTITQSWSGKAPFMLRVAEPPQVKVGEQGNYALDVVNMTDQAADAVLRMTIPDGFRIVSSQPPVSAISNGTAIWVIDGIPPKASSTVQITGEVLASGMKNFSAQVDRKTSSSILDSAPSIPAASGPSSGSAVPSSPPRDPFGLESNTNPPAPKTVTSVPQLVFTEPFPQETAAGTEFSALVKVVSSSADAKPVIISMVFSSDLAYIEKPSGKTHSGTESAPLEFQAASFNLDYPIHFVASSPGVKSIEIRLLDSETKQVVASEKKSINITPAAVPAASAANPVAAAGASGPKASIAFDVQGDNAPDFVKGRDVKFLFKIKNNVNYQLESLIVDATPDFSHQVNPWGLVSSDPPGVTPLVDGTYRLSVPAVPAGGEKTITLTLTAKEKIDAGTFVAVLLDETGTALGEIKSTYSIQELHQANYPSENAPQEAENTPSDAENTAPNEENSNPPAGNASPNAENTPVNAEKPSASAENAAATSEKPDGSKKSSSPKSEPISL